jgi:hypothetical protein
VVPQSPVEIIDLEKYPVTVSVECTEVVFFMWVVGVAEVVVHRDGLDNPFDGFLAERSDARCDDCETPIVMLAKLVVEYKHRVLKNRQRQFLKKADDERPRRRDFLRFMQDDQPKYPTKGELRVAAMGDLEVSKASFDFAWIDAIGATRRTIVSAAARTATDQNLARLLCALYSFGS